MLRIISKFIVVISLLSLVTACTKEEPKVLDQNDDYVGRSIEMLSNKSIVLDTKVFMGEEDKTLLPKGCPTKFHFKWLSNTKQMEISLTDFHIGKMPFQINYRSNVPFEELSSWDKEVYPEKGWVKFQANEAWLKVGILTLNKYKKKPAKIEGFINPIRQEVQFKIEYNMMNVKSLCNRQKIDFNRINNYQQELEQYGKDLEAYKKAKGML